MNWIALKMLTGDRAKFFGIVMGLTFAALLITQQGSIFCGLMLRTAGQVSDITGADLWVMDENVRYIDDVKPMLENNLSRVRSVEGVKWAVPLYKGNGRVKLTPESHRLIPDESSKSAPGRPRRMVREQKVDKVIEQVVLLGLDDSSMVGAPPAQRIHAGNLEDLRKPESIMVDFNRLRKLYPSEEWSLLKLHRKPAGQLTDDQRSDFMQAYGQIPIDENGLVNFYNLFLGREMEMNDHRAFIVAICEATRTFQSNPVVYTTFSRAKLFIPRERKMLSYILVKIDQPDTASELSTVDRLKYLLGFSPSAAGSSFKKRLAESAGWTVSTPNADQVARQIKVRTGLKSRTRHSFMWDTIWYYMIYTGIPINFGITAALGFFVGTAIAGQTFYNFTLENLKQFGALKAMGATNLRIVQMILLQATVVGLLGYGIGVGLAALFGVSTQGGELAFYTAWEVLPVTVGAIVLICILSSLLCIRKVVVLEPAIVFRG